MFNKKNDFERSDPSLLSSEGCDKAKSDRVDDNNGDDGDNDDGNIMTMTMIIVMIMMMILNFNAETPIVSWK